MLAKFILTDGTIIKCNALSTVTKPLKDTIIKSIYITSTKKIDTIKFKLKKATNKEIVYLEIAPKGG